MHASRKILLLELFSMSRPCKIDRLSSVRSKCRPVLDSRTRTETHVAVDLALSLLSSEICFTPISERSSTIRDTGSAESTPSFSTRAFRNEDIASKIWPRGRDELASLRNGSHARSATALTTLLFLVETSSVTTASARAVDRSSSSVITFATSLRSSVSAFRGSSGTRSSSALSAARLTSTFFCLRSLVTVVSSSSTIGKSNPAIALSAILSTSRSAARTVTSLFNRWQSKATVSLAVWVPRTSA
mmetsp:Transcript_14036/g.20395  ORF Transcript_14036/g.20395 Transcript_14036/m.20395 type:complete len:245 (+) Transcript_14036:98-832(+)